jgi:hypothetical protein
MKRDPINELWAWVVQQPNGVEKIATPELFHNTYQLVASSRELADLRMRDLAQAVERETGYPTKLVKFVRVEVVDDK